MFRKWIINGTWHGKQKLNFVGVFAKFLIEQFGFHKRQATHICMFLTNRLNFSELKIILTGLKESLQGKLSVYMYIPSPPGNKCCNV